MNAPDWTLLAAPLAAGMLVLATHVPLGIEVLRRGIIFLDLAVAQTAALGVMAAHLLGWDAPEVAHGFGAQIAAAASAVAGALMLTWTGRRWPHLQEALIGLLFVVAASAGILLLAGNPHGGEHLRDLLGGQVLWVGWPQLGPVAVIYAAMLWLWFALRRSIGDVGFYVIFAAAVTASVQVVGVFLVFASLIAPAVATAGMPRLRLAVAWLLGSGAYAAGLAISLLFDLPSGPAIVCCLGLFALLALLAAPKRAS